MAKSTMPWWLEEQTELCAFCRQPYACGLERWCVECDRAVCPLCAGEAEDGHACPDCRERAEVPPEAA